MAKSLRRRWPLALLLTTAMLGIVIVLQQRVPGLMEVSHPLLHPVGQDLDSYLWEGEDDLIFVRNRYSVVRYNRRTRAQTPLSSAPDRLMQDARPATHEIGDLEVHKSPDGAWLQWRPHWGCTYLLSLAGAKHLRCAADPDIAARQFVWFADSKRYAVFGFEPFHSNDTTWQHEKLETFSEVCLADLRHPGKEFHLPVVPKGLLIRHDVLAAVGLKNQILLVAASIGNHLALAPTTLTLYRCSFGKTATLQKQTPFPVSTDAHIDEVVLSADGKRLAWVEHSRWDSPLKSLLEPLLPRIEGVSNWMVLLCTCRMDGTDRREIGFLSAYIPEREPEVTGIQWLTDNQHLSFVHNDTLYTVRGK